MQEIILRPSSVRSFLEVPNVWYRRHIDGIEDFKGNTSTYLGTVCHAYAESFYTLNPFNPHAILENAPEDVDKAFILQSYKPMCDELESKYLIKQPKPELIEYFMKLDLGDGFICQGTLDTYDNGVLTDYKTASRQTKNMNDYIYQLHIYAYLLSLTEREVHTYRIVSIINATKTMGARVNILECRSDVKKGKELVELMHKKTKLALDNPQYKDIIFTENPYSFLSDTKEVETLFKEL